MNAFKQERDELEGLVGFYLENRGTMKGEERFSEGLLPALTQWARNFFIRVCPEHWCPLTQGYSSLPEEQEEGCPDEKASLLSPEGQPRSWLLAMDQNPNLPTLAHS